MYCLAFLYIIIALVAVGSYYANAGKSALKGRIEKGAGLALFAVLITADLGDAIGMNPYKQPPWLLFQH
jgi:hypothetical protein